MNDKSNPARPPDTWASGVSYEPFVGRWSRLVAREFLTWLDVASKSRWLDVGCGTGALSQTILQMAAPSRLKGIDRSSEFIAHARAHIQDDRVTFEAGDAQQLTDESAAYDAVVSGLMLNFVPQPQLALSEMVRVAKPGGRVSGCARSGSSRTRFARKISKPSGSGCARTASPWISRFPTGRSSLAGTSMAPGSSISRTRRSRRMSSGCSRPSDPPLRRLPGKTAECCAASEGGAPFVARRAMNLHGCALPHCAPPPAATPHSALGFPQRPGEVGLQIAPVFDSNGEPYQRRG